MQKALLYALAAAANVAGAVLAFRSGRIVVPVILMIATFCFVMAAIGQARSGGGPKIEQ